LYGRKLNEKDKGNSLKEKTTSGPRARAGLVLFTLAQRAPNRAWAGPAGHRCSTLPDQAHTALAYAAWPSKQSDAGPFLLARKTTRMPVLFLYLTDKRDPYVIPYLQLSPISTETAKGGGKVTRRARKDSLCPFQLPCAPSIRVHPHERTTLDPATHLAPPSCLARVHGTAMDRREACHLLTHQNRQGFDLASPIDRQPHHDIVNLDLEHITALLSPHPLIPPFAT
jgi:hypothetical protein